MSTVSQTRWNLRFHLGSMTSKSDSLLCNIDNFRVIIVYSWISDKKQDIDYFRISSIPERGWRPKPERFKSTKCDFLLTQFAAYRARSIKLWRHNTPLLRCCVEHRNAAWNSEICRPWLASLVRGLKSHCRGLHKVGENPNVVSLEK